MSGFKVGDSVRVVGNTVARHHYNIGDVVTVENVYDTERFGVRGPGDRSPFQIIYIDDLELIEECGTMAHNNGDLIKAQVSRDDYGAPVYNLFVKFGEFYYNLSSPKQMRGAKNLPKGTKHTVGTMSGTGDHMLAAIEGSDMTGDASEAPEVAKVGAPFDDGRNSYKEIPLGVREVRRWDLDGSEIVGISSSGTTSDFPMTATEIEKRNRQALKALEEFNKAFTGSGLMTSNKLSDEELAKKDGYDLMKS